MEENTMKYPVFIIKEKNSDYGVTVPDLPGCIATGDTLSEVEQHIREAIEFHIEGMRADGLTIPAPRSRVEYVSVAA